jgi:hypothetical protein
VHRQLQNTGRSTPPISSRPPSNYGSPTEPSPIPFRPTIQSRRWSSPASPLSRSLELRDDRKQHAVRFARVSPSPPAKPRLHLDLEHSRTLPTPTSTQKKTLTFTGLAFGAASGVISGICLIIAKAGVELLILTFKHFSTGEGENQFARVQTWVLLLTLGLGAGAQFVYLQYSLTLAGPALVCPLAFCFFNMSSIFGRSSLGVILTFRWLDSV